MTIPEIRVYGLNGIPEVRPGDDLGELVASALETSKLTLTDGDVLVVTQKIVSKAEGRVVPLSTVEPSAIALTYAERYDKDARLVEVVLRESVRIVRMERGVMICETRHGFVCANAGVDRSNVPGDDEACLLPLDPDRSAAQLREALRARFNVAPPVIISDTFGRPWRKGQTNIAIGVAGMEVFNDYRGQVDAWGHDLRVTMMAVADELAATAELVHGKTVGRPVALIRGFEYPRGDGTATDLVLEPEKDLFR